MKEMHHIWVLLMISLFVCTPISVHGFTASETHQQIQTQLYSATSLPLETDVFKRSKKQIGWTTQPMANAKISISHQCSEKSFVPTIRVVQGTNFHVNAWRGSTTSVGACAPESTVSKRRSNGIGSGNTPNNPTYVPIGDLPLWLMMLLAIGYMAFRRKSNSEM